MYGTFLDKTIPQICVFNAGGALVGTLVILKSGSEYAKLVLYNI